MLPTPSLLPTFTPLILPPCQVVCADGTFIDGSTIELSCDGPLRPPFVAYCQVRCYQHCAKLEGTGGCCQMSEGGRMKGCC